LKLSKRALLKSLGTLGALGAATAFVMLPNRGNAYYSGPVTDHFDGTRFFNAGAEEPRTFASFMRLQFTETWATWPTAIPAVVPHIPPAAVGPSGIRLTLIGHATWLIQTAGVTLLIDPVWSDRASPVTFAGPKRVTPPAIPMDQLPPIHAVLITHNHYDHMDLSTVARLFALYRPLFLTPLGNDTIIRSAVPEASIVALDWHQAADLSPSLTVSAVPTLHWSARGLLDRQHALWASFILRAPGGTIYAVGDTGFGDGQLFRQIGQHYGTIDMALLPIGAYEPRWFMKDQHMNPAEAVAAMQLCGARRALGHHWGTFQLTAEEHDSPARELNAAVQQSGLSSDRFVAVRSGEHHGLNIGT
jgi:L-ascorbate metabolism protein UlaG (beta-lactamase superfamily)